MNVRARSVMKRILGKKPYHVGIVQDCSTFDVVWACQHVHTNRYAAQTCAALHLERNPNMEEKPQPPPQKEHPFDIIKDVMHAAADTPPVPQVLQAIEAKEELEQDGPIEKDLFVFARNPQEMAASQGKMVQWATAKVEDKKKEWDEINQNLAIAKKNKWSTAGFRSNLVAVTKKVQFFEKLKAALEAGFCIIPDMGMDVFAIRTKKVAPLPNTNESRSSFGQVWVPPQQTENPPLGEGVYVSPIAENGKDSYTKKSADGSKDITVRTAWAQEFKELDFPFKLAKPGVLNETARALAASIFDEVGVLPRRAKADPMVVGRIKYKHGKNERSVSFCIAWFLETKDFDL